MAPEFLVLSFSVTLSETCQELRASRYLGNGRNIASRVISARQVKEPLIVQYSIFAGLLTYVLHCVLNRPFQHTIANKKTS